MMIFDNDLYLYANNIRQRNTAMDPEGRVDIRCHQLGRMNSNLHFPSLKGSNLSVSIPQMWLFVNGHPPAQFRAINNSIKLPRDPW